MYIKDNIQGKQIPIDPPLDKENAVGFLAKTSAEEIAIFSLYIPPNYDISLNQDLFVFFNKYNKFILARNLNANSPLWHCKTKKDQN